MVFPHTPPLSTLSLPLYDRVSGLIRETLQWH
jgi:hypothetical protein